MPLHVVREAENECSQEQGSILRTSYKWQISGAVDAIDEEPDSIEEEKKHIKPWNFSNATDEEPVNWENLSSSSSEEKPK